MRLKDWTQTALNGAIGLTFLAILGVCLFKQRVRDLTKRSP